MFFFCFFLEDYGVIEKQYSTLYQELINSDDTDADPTFNCDDLSVDTDDATSNELDIPKKKEIKQNSRSYKVTMKRI